MLHVIAGPTASGKTARAIALAKSIGAEIISADSQQVYRYFNIGTAKPTDAQLNEVPHHLISVVEPHESFSAARYQLMADQAIAQIRSRGREVVVVGGTGLYLRILLHGVVAAPSGDESIRARLEALGSDELHQRLHQVDPKTAAKLPVADRVRVVRALEIFELTGKPASAHREEHAFAADRHHYQLTVLEPDREALYRQINDRTRAMFDAGLVDETRALVERGFRDAAPMGSVGYAQALKVVDGEWSVEQAVADAAQKTRHYAKRQLTWFRKEKGARFETT